jgi:hypothetical protein
LEAWNSFFLHARIHILTNGKIMPMMFFFAFIFECQKEGGGGGGRVGGVIQTAVVLNPVFFPVLYS